MRREPDSTSKFRETASPLEHQTKEGSWKLLWQTATRFEAGKITPWLALRNAIGVAVPLAVGIATGRVTSGLVVSAGALNVSFSDGDDPYGQRARRMLAASLLVGIAVYVGALSGQNGVLAVFMAAAWAFASGMLVAIGAPAADLGIVSLVTLVVFAGQPMPVERAALSGVLAFAGGLLQTFLALVLWPVRRYDPERRALGSLYLELSRAAALPIKSSEPPPATEQSTQAHSSLAALDRNHSIEGERYRLLLNQAERIRLSLLTLARLRNRLQRESQGSAEAEILDRFFVLCEKLLASVAGSLGAGGPADRGPNSLQEIHALAEELRHRGPEAPTPFLSAMALNARSQVDAIAGQLRAAIDLAASTTPAGRDAFERREAGRPWTLRLSGTIATLRANLTFQSAACRHAVRLAACLALGDALGRAIHLSRSYWLPMTVAIVLKPDFRSTFSRGLLRVAGTLTGLTLATAVFHVLPATAVTEVTLIAVLTFVLRCFGPANYGIFVAVVSALVVVLIALTGIAPAQVIAARGLNTAIGGALALLAYWLWPTWERTRVAEAIAQMLDAYRDYFHIVAQGYLKPDGEFLHELDRTRQAGRLARSNLLASIDRLSAEPNGSEQILSSLTAMLASSHRLAHAFMALEAGLSISLPAPPREAFRFFADHVERTLYFLAAALRGFRLRSSDLPDLREDHHSLIQSGDSLTERYTLVNLETDRVTDSLNTLREQILRWTNTDLQA